MIDPWRSIEIAPDEEDNWPKEIQKQEARNSGNDHRCFGYAIDIYFHIWILGIKLVLQESLAASHPPQNSYAKTLSSSLKYTKNEPVPNLIDSGL